MLKSDLYSFICPFIVGQCPSYKKYSLGLIPTYNHFSSDIFFWYTRLKMDHPIALTSLVCHSEVLTLNRINVLCSLDSQTR